MTVEEAGRLHSSKDRNADVEGAGQRGKRLAVFILENIKPIVTEWEGFARTLTPSSAEMTPLALRDHIHQILKFIVADITSAQTDKEQTRKSHGKRDTTAGTAAETHAALRLAGGFDIGQMVSEYRALRASVIKLWSKVNSSIDAEDINDLTRFNESIDQELAESVTYYTKEVLHSKDLFMGILGHDLRSPVQAIMLSAELIPHLGILNDRQAMLTKNVVEGADRINILINNLLDVTRSRFGGGQPVVRSLMDMGFVGRQIVDEARVVHPDRVIDLDVSGELGGEWDKARIGQVFSNLLGNAIQYSFASTSVAVGIKGMAHAVTLTVHNVGTPIAPKDMKTIFDPLTRSSAGNGSHSGTINLGLGLFITRQVVVAHGGTIEVSSNEENGTTFTVRLPRLPAADSHQQQLRQAQ